MDIYLEKLAQLLRIDSGAIHGVMVVNKQGIVEYFRSSGSQEADAFEKDAIGRHLLSVYPSLTEETSTVMRSLRTGAVIKGAAQSLISENVTLDLCTTTYPILDEGGQVLGAVDVAYTVPDIRCLAPDAEERARHTALDRIITRNRTIRTLKNQTLEIAKTDSPVLIYGETGTGKELFAEALHLLSPWGKGPFIAQNCAAIPSELLEGMFFGTEKGGFTGAESKKGLFELADGGTLFLDEINSMNTAMQTKLLKALEEKTVRRIGGREDIRFQVRIICASNEEPEELVRQKRMRADFYYRIGVVQLRIPPLRDRMEDVPPLTDYYIQTYNRKMGKQIQGLSLMARELFSQYDWPGNVRELKNVIEGAFNTESSSMITLNSVQGLLSRLERRGEQADCLSAIRAQMANGPVDLKALVEQFEGELIREALRQTRHLNEAARLLSISPQKLQYRMEKLKLKA